MIRCCAGGRRRVWRAVAENGRMSHQRHGLAELLLCGGGMRRENPGERQQNRHDALHHNIQQYHAVEQGKMHNWLYTHSFGTLMKVITDNCVILSYSRYILNNKSIPIMECMGCFLRKSNFCAKKTFWMRYNI